MQKFRFSWLGVAAFTLMLFSNLTSAIDNPDAPDLVAEFELREKSFIAAIEEPANTTSGYAIAKIQMATWLAGQRNKNQGLSDPEKIPVLLGKAN